MIAIALLFSFIGAVWCAIVAGTKNISIAGYAFLGFLFPLIGVIVVHVARPAPTAEPEP